MRIIKIDFKNIEPGIIDEIVGYLEKGKVIVYPTDTIYGLGCDAEKAGAIRKIKRIKKRPADKPFLILVKSWCMLKKYCYVSAKQDKYLRSLMPGPTTVVLKKRPSLSDELTGGLDSVAVRMPDNDFLRLLLKKFNKPIVSTSVNISGELSLSDPQNISKIFKGIDLIIDAGKIKKKKPSRIIDVRDINNIKIIRK